ncbi:MAG: hypothetical protein JXR96_15215 [Deltaproteobacteria bacterium]|nr:hypothetical protein [Deltaproteobacteria bacterium]
MLRHRVGVKTLSGYLVVDADQEGFFPEPEDGEIEIRIHFDEGQQLRARLFRSAGRRRRLKLAYTGEAGAGFRAWLKRSFPARKGRGPRGVLVLKRRSARSCVASAESVSQASVELLWPLGRRYFEGARPLCVLHPAMQDLEAGLRELALPDRASVRELGRALSARLRELGWQETESVGGGLALQAGLRRSQAQLHPVLQTGDLYPALLALAIGFELRAIDLGVLLVADGKLSARLQREAHAPASSVERALREMKDLAFLLRGPICLIGLSARSELR